MRNLKRVLALALALVMVIGMMVIGSSAASYSDASAVDAKYSEAVDVLSGMGVFQGTDTGAFAPKAVLTRAEASALIYRVITGDVKDAQTVNYKYSTFKDVAADAWYTGYITYASNGGYIKGYEGNAMPNDTVTGIQVMAIMLRAAGYGQNGEYEGDGWMDNILTDAKELGITGTIATSTLMAGATREVVAQLIFNAITKVGMVTYTPALGYLAVDFTENDWRGTTTLGKKVFGLTCSYGAIVGNQATGQDVTMIDLLEAGDSYYEYDYQVGNKYAEDFAIETGLDMYGHAVKVWYDSRYNLYNHYVGAQVYAMYDETVKSALVTVLNEASIEAAGFKKGYDYKWLDEHTVYSNAYDKFDKDGMDAEYPLYVLIANDGYHVDVVIGIDAKVAKIASVDTTAATKTLTLANYGTIALKNVLSGSTTNLGATVIVNKVVGTTGDTKYDLDAVTKTVVGTVVEVNARTGKIILADGTSIEKSPLYDYVVSGVDQVTAWKNVKYTIVLDNNGQYLGATEYNDNTFIYGTFADYASAGTNTGTVNYYLTGVTLNGEIVTKDVTANISDWYSYVDMTVAQKVWSFDTLQDGTHTGYTINSKGVLTSDVDELRDIGVHLLNNNWAIGKADVIGGYSVNGDNTHFMTNATKFIVVSGTGTDSLKVTTYNGISELLGSATGVTIEGGANVYLTKTPYIYNSLVNTKDTYHVDTVILGTDDLTYVNSSNLYYVDEVETGLASTAMVGGEVINVYQYKMYKDGEAAFYYLTAAPTADTFYILVEDGKTVSGATLYTAVDTANGTDSGVYAYLGATNNLDTAVIDSVLYTVTGAKVVNLVSPALALGSIAELNNAVSVGYTVEVDCVVSNGATALIYVTAVTAPGAAK